MLDLFLSTAETVRKLHMIKQAQEEEKNFFSRFGRRPKYHYLFGKRIGQQEAKNIENALKKRQPRTEVEENIQSVVGARPTLGQIKRTAILGAGGGIGMHLLGSALEGGEDLRWMPDLSEGKVKGLLKRKTPAVLHPRSLLRAASVGGILSGAVPVAKRMWDIQTARENPEGF